MERLRTAPLLPCLVLQSQQSQIIFYLELKWTVVNSDKPALQSILSMLPPAKGNLSWLRAWLWPSLHHLYSAAFSWMEEQEKVIQPSSASDLEKHAKNKDGNHTQHTSEKLLRKTSEKTLGIFMGGPCRTQENWWKVRCQIWWYCWIFRNPDFLRLGHSPHHCIIFTEP